MGAAGRCQARAEAVTVPGRTSLTCGNVVQWRVCRVVRSVRIAVLIDKEGYSRALFVMLNLPGAAACLHEEWPVSRKDVAPYQILRNRPS